MGPNQHGVFCLGSQESKQPKSPGSADGTNTGSQGPILASRHTQKESKVSNSAEAGTK
jgi:hypothetical protein